MDSKMIPSIIVESLVRSGAMEFDELFKAVQKLQSDLNQHDFNRTLMELEVQGLIRVSKMTRGKKRIELA
jgi:hypothetical protein